MYPTMMGVIYEVVIFCLCFRLISVLVQGFVFPAVECLSLRRGGLSEVVGILTFSLIGSLNEVGLSIVSSFKGNVDTDNSVVVCTILGSGWISLLVLPVAALNHGPFVVNWRSLGRDMAFYTLFCISVLLIGVHESSIALGSSLVMLLFGIYILVLVRMVEKERTIRQENRERRLIFQMKPIAAVLNQFEALDRLQTDLEISRGPYIPLRDMTSSPPPLELSDDSPLTIRRESYLETSIEARWLSKVCVRSLPGTDSERLYLVSLLNSSFLLLLLSSVICAVCDRWVSFVVGGLPSRFIGPLVVAGFSQLSEILHASTVPNSDAASHVVSSAMTRQVSILALGVALPWMIRSALIGQSVQLDFESIRTCVKASFLAITLFATNCLICYRAGSLHFRSPWGFIGSYAVVLVVFAWMSASGFH